LTTAQIYGQYRTAHFVLELRMHSKGRCVLRAICVLQPNVKLIMGIELTVQRRVVQSLTVWKKVAVGTRADKALNGASLSVSATIRHLHPQLP